VLTNNYSNECEQQAWRLWSNGLQFNQRTTECTGGISKQKNKQYVYHTM